MNSDKSYFQFHMQNIGMEARIRGRVICKAQAYQIDRAGRGQMLEWLDKPGWKNGELVDQTMYHHYLNRVFF